MAQLPCSCGDQRIWLSSPTMPTQIPVESARDRANPGTGVLARPPQPC